MKANPSRAILRIFLALGLHVDASSDHEVERALAIGVPADRIQLTSQMPSRSLEDHVARGASVRAGHQLLEPLGVDRRAVPRSLGETGLERLPRPGAGQAVVAFQGCCRRWPPCLRSNGALP